MEEADDADMRQLFDTNVFRAVDMIKEHDHELQYKGLESTLKLADKQRDGIFGTAEKMIQCLKSRNTLRWVAPTGGATVATDARRQFNPHAFAASQETIYILFQGRGRLRCPAHDSLDGGDR